MRYYKLIMSIALMGGILAITNPAAALQCVPFAREVSGISLRGDAWTWWRSAAGIYQRGQTPKLGAVVVFKKHGHMQRGHVAVVSRVLDSRHILINHANWAPHRAAGRGQITTMVAVVDVSRKNDWSEVRVWSADSSEFGTSVYPTYGFIYPATRQTTARIGDASKAVVQQIAAHYADQAEEYSPAASASFAVNEAGTLSLDLNASSDNGSFDLQAANAVVAPALPAAPISVAKLESPIVPATTPVAPSAASVAMMPVPNLAPSPTPTLVLNAVAEAPAAGAARIVLAKQSEPVAMPAAGPSLAWEGDAAAAKSAGAGRY